MIGFKIYLHLCLKRCKVFIQHHLTIVELSVLLPEESAEGFHDEVTLLRSQKAREIAEDIRMEDGHRVILFSHHHLLRLKVQR